MRETTPLAPREWSRLHSRAMYNVRTPHFFLYFYFLLVEIRNEKVRLIEKK
jgi:hypothetical protein